MKPSMNLSLNYKHRFAKEKKPVIVEVPPAMAGTAEAA